jgi:hypothetical protein
MAGHSDPTLLAIARLDDPSLYEVTRHVPIFKAHTKKAKRADGSEYEIKVTDADLPEIAQNMKDLEEEDGVLSRIVDGHIRPDPNVPESEQPGLLGYQAHPHVGRWGPDQQLGVLVDHYILKHKVGIAKERPYRSAEYYPPTKTIKGCALMIRDPFLNLGTVNYVAEGQPYLYSMSRDSSVADSSETIQSDDDKDDFTPEETAQYNRMCRYMKKCHPKLAMYMDGGAPAASAPSGGNTFVPGETKKPQETNAMAEPYANQQAPELYAMLQQTNEKLAKVEQRNTALEQQNSELMLDRERNRCKEILNPLVETYSFDYKRELATLLPLKKEERAAHVEYMKANYRPRATDESLPIEVYSGDVEGGTQQRQTTPAQENQAVSLATKKGITYDAALEEIRKNGRAA